MESLIIFLIFIVFSVLRSLGESQQKQQGRGPTAPKRPVRPNRQDVPSPMDLPKMFREMLMEPEQKDRQEQLEQKTVVEEEYRPETVMPKEKKPVRRQIVTKRVEPEVDENYAIRVLDEDGSLPVDKQTLIQGIIFAEVLGAPRAKKLWRPRQQ